MFANLIINYSGDVILTNAKFLSQSILHFTHFVSLSDCINLKRCYPSLIMCFSLWLSTISLVVCLIIFRSIPAKIFELVIRGITVVVAGLHFGRTWANEGEQYKAVYHSGNRFSIMPKRNIYTMKLVTMQRHHSWRTGYEVIMLATLMSPKRPNATKI